MKKTIFIKIFALIFLFFYFLTSSLNSVKASNLSDSPSFFVKTYDKAGYKYVNEDVFFGVIIQTALSFIGVIFLVLMIYGGYLWMTARGDEEQVTKAKSLFTATIIGLVIVISAYAISYFVIKTLGGPTLGALFLNNYLC